MALAAGPAQAQAGAPPPVTLEISSGKLTLEAHNAALGDVLQRVARALDARLSIPAELAARLEAEHGERFAPSTVHRFFRRHGVTRKKRPAMRSSRTARTS